LGTNWGINGAMENDAEMDAGKTAKFSRQDFAGDPNKMRGKL
jgi:hypothetical protein